MQDTTLLDDDLRPSLSNLTNEQIAEINLEKINLTDHLDNFRMGRHVLIGLAILAIIGMVLGLVANPYEVNSEDIIIEGVVLCGLYALCALLMTRKPLLAMALGAGIYTCVVALTALVDPSTVFSGIIIKIVIVIGFFRGFRGYFDAKMSGDKLRKLGVPEQEVLTALRKIQKIPRTPRHDE